MTQSGIIFDVKRFAVHDGPGIRTTVFLKGCPLNCQWCHNPESRRHRPERVELNGTRRCARWLKPEVDGVVGREVTAERCLQEIEKDLAFYDQSGGGATFSGGEPLMQPDFLKALLSGCRDRGIHTAVDTSGHTKWAELEPLLALVDLFLFDLKLVDPAHHKSYIGVYPDLIFENLIRLHGAGANIIARVPLIPGITDTYENLSGIRDLVSPLSGIREVHLLPYNRMAADKYRRLGRPNPLAHLQKQPEDELKHMRAIFENGRLHVRIGG